MGSVLSGTTEAAPLRRRSRCVEEEDLPAAFQVTNTTTTTFCSYAPMVFDKVVTRIGNSYDETRGIFNCQVRGTYLFHLTIVAAKFHNVEISICVNDVAKSTAVSDRQQSIGLNQGTTMAILSLAEGDEVTIQSHSPNEEIQLEGQSRCCFCGHLLQAS